MKYSTRIKPISYVKANAAELIRELAAIAALKRFPERGRHPAALLGRRLVRD